MKRYATVADIGNCDLLFIPSSESSQLKQISEKTKGKPTLLVTEREGVARKGASINFLTLDYDTLKFEVNKKEMENSKLKIASILIDLGFVVG